MAKGYPNKVFEQEVRKRGLNVKLLWQIKGPKDTQITWISCYFIHPITVIHMAYVEGWDIYIGSDTVKIDATIDDIVNRVISKV